MKQIACGDLVPGCPYRARAESEPDVLHVWAKHVRETHGMDVSEQFLNRARARVEETQPPDAA